MFVSEKISGMVFLLPFILVVILYIIRLGKILKRIGYHLSDLYNWDEKWKIVRKEERKAYPFFWLLKFLGLVCAVIRDE